MKKKQRLSYPFLLQSLRNKSKIICILIVFAFLNMSIGCSYYKSKRISTNSDNFVGQYNSVNKKEHYAIIHSGNEIMHLINIIVNEDKKEITLTEKEKTFLQLLSSEMTYKEIAAVMSVSSRMIDGYKSALCERFQVKTRVGLVMYAVKNKLIEISNGLD